MGAVAARRVPALRRLVLPTEHGGWGFLFEPLVLGFALAPSAAGLLIAVAALFGFLTRQPLKLAMQDALRRKSYPRTFWCRLFAASYAAMAIALMAGAVALTSWKLLLPFAVVAPLALITLVFDARNRSRSPLPEYAGAIAMSSTAAAIAIAGGRGLLFAAAASALILTRAIPAIVYVRILLRRAHAQVASSWPGVVAHIVAIGAAFVVGSWIAAAAATALLGRAVWALTHTVPPAKTIGWREIAWGAVTVATFAFAL